MEEISVLRNLECFLSLWLNQPCLQFWGNGSLSKIMLVIMFSVDCIHDQFWSFKYGVAVCMDSLQEKKNRSDYLLQVHFALGQVRKEVV